MATAAEKTAAEKQINDIETALAPVVVKMDAYLGDGVQIAVSDGDAVPFPKVRQEASNLYHQIQNFLGLTRTHQIVRENEKKESSS